MNTLSKISVYYDRLCPLCSKEIAHYRKQRGQEILHFIDITAPEFNAGQEGLDPQKVHQVMHVKTANGELKTGLDAFITIWETLPNYNRLANIAKNRFLKPFLNLGYHIFSFFRPYLPRKSSGCEDSPYCETRKL